MKRELCKKSKRNHKHVNNVVSDITKRRTGGCHNRITCNQPKRKQGEIRGKEMKGRRARINNTKKQKQTMKVRSNSMQLIEPSRRK